MILGYKLSIDTLVIFILLCLLLKKFYNSKNNIDEDILSYNKEWIGEVEFTWNYKSEKGKCVVENIRPVCDICGCDLM